MKIGLVDTTFSRVDMAEFALSVFSGKGISIERYTVPGIKDIPVACKKLFYEFDCDIIIALGMVGSEDIDIQCGHEASTAIQLVQLEFSRHILEVFVHMREATNNLDLFELAKNRTTKHAENVLALLNGKESLSKFAGTGRRQGRNDEGPVRL